MAATLDQLNRTDDKANGLIKDVGVLEGKYEALATKVDVESIKNWLLWRTLIGVAIIQGVIAWVMGTVK